MQPRWLPTSSLITCLECHRLPRRSSGYPVALARSWHSSARMANGSASLTTRSLSWKRKNISPRFYHASMPSVSVDKQCPFWSEQERKCALDDLDEPADSDLMPLSLGCVEHVAICVKTQLPENPEEKRLAVQAIHNFSRSLNQEALGQIAACKLFRPKVYQGNKKNKRVVLNVIACGSPTRFCIAEISIEPKL